MARSTTRIWRNSWISPCWLSARAHLGTLNHTALTLQYARQRGLKVIGVVINGLDRKREDPSVEDNPALIEEMGEVPVFGTIDWFPEEPDASPHGRGYAPPS